MDTTSWNTPQLKAIVFGIIVAVLLALFRIPPAAALVAGIMFGFVAFVVGKDALRSDTTEK